MKKASPALFGVLRIVSSASAADSARVSRPLPLLGIFVIVGIAVSNSILLVDFANHRVAAGVTLCDAVVDATRTRMRPILMNALAGLRY
jgi:Cu/Ag efflux pump CusA